MKYSKHQKTRKTITASLLAAFITASILSDIDAAMFPADTEHAIKQEMIQNLKPQESDNIEHADNQNHHESEDTDDVKDKNSDSEKKKTVTGKWKEKNQQFYYYINGKRVTGIYKINQKYYYFDKNGVQRTGWQKIGDDYYFFRIANGKKGYRETSQTVNGIWLGAKGRAKITAGNKTKLDIMTEAAKIVQKAAKPAVKKPEKLKKVFDYLLKNYRYAGSPSFAHSAHWEQDYAQFMFRERHGSCYSYGAAFAFLANAVGYSECYAISSGGHGWAEVNGKVYDPSWCLADPRYSYFGVSPALSGVGGRPNYKRARNFVARI